MAVVRASEEVRAEWLRRVHAEYTSAALTQHLGLWLIQIGASPDLIKASLRIVTDEIEHARLSQAAYLGAGYSQGLGDGACISAGHATRLGGGGLQPSCWQGSGPYAVHDPSSLRSTLQPSGAGPAMRPVGGSSVSTPGGLDVGASGCGLPGGLPGRLLGGGVASPHPAAAKVTTKAAASLGARLSMRGRVDGGSSVTSRGRGRRARLALRPPHPNAHGHQYTNHRRQNRRRPERPRPRR